MLLFLFIFLMSHCNKNYWFYLLKKEEKEEEKKEVSHVQYHIIRLYKLLILGIREFLQYLSGSRPNASWRLSTI